MPFIITGAVPETVTQTFVIENDRVEVQATRTVDRVNIEHIIINMPPNNAAGVSITVKWSMGYQDSAVFFSTRRGTAEFAGDSLLQAMMAPVTPDISHYADFKGAIYGLLIASGHIPAGTVV